MPRMQAPQVPPEGAEPEDSAPPGQPTRARATPVVAPGASVTPEERRERILVALRGGATRSGAPIAAGVGRSTFYEWLKDEAFAQSVEEAEVFFETTSLAQLRKAGIEAEVIRTFDQQGRVIREVRKWDWRAIAWVLEHHPALKARWSAIQKAELTGPQGGPIPVAGQIEFRPDKAWLEEYQRAAAELPAEIAPQLEAPKE